MNNAQKALDGTRMHFQYGAWPDVQSDTQAVLQGTNQGSSYAVTDNEGVIKRDGQFSGDEEKVIVVEKGRTLRVTHCWVAFKRNEMPG